MFLEQSSLLFDFLTTKFLYNNEFLQDILFHNLMKIDPLYSQMLLIINIESKVWQAYLHYVLHKQALSRSLSSI